MVGNDVVDLGDPEVRPESIHPRFDRRVFTDGELRLIKRDRRPNEKRWLLWACKESAYKLVKRRDSATVFSPRTFEVEMNNSGAARVHQRGGTVNIEITRHGDAVHAVATWSQDDDNRIISAIGTVRSEPSGEVRELARQQVAHALSVAEHEIEIASGPDNIPKLLVGGHESKGYVSLSHHGRFVASACCFDSTAGE